MSPVLDVGGGSKYVTAMLPYGHRACEYCISSIIFADIWNYPDLPGRLHPACDSPDQKECPDAKLTI